MSKRPPKPPTIFIYNKKTIFGVYVGGRWVFYGQVSVSAAAHFYLRRTVLPAYDKRTHTTTAQATHSPKSSHLQQQQPQQQQHQ